MSRQPLLIKIFLKKKFLCYTAFMIKDIDILIIGGGPAGLMAATYASQAGAKVIVVEQSICGGQITTTPEIENMPGFPKITGAELAIFMTDQAEEKGAEIAYEDVTNINFEQPFMVTTNENIYRPKAIILATGARPRRTYAKDEEKFIGKGIHFCGLCDGALYKDKDIIVVGGGNSAVEEIIYLSELVNSITVVNNMPMFTAIETSVEKIGALKNVVNVYHNTTMENFSGEKRLSSVTINKDGKLIDIPCHGVFMAIGRQPNNDIFKGKIKMTKDGYIKTDANMQTNIPGVYGAGDICDKHIRQIVTATSDGAIAAIAAAAYIKC